MTLIMTPSGGVFFASALPVNFDRGGQSCNDYVGFGYPRCSDLPTQGCQDRTLSKRCREINALREKQRKMLCSTSKGRQQTYLASVGRRSSSSQS